MRCWGDPTECWGAHAAPDGLGEQRHGTGGTDALQLNGSRRGPAAEAGGHELPHVVVAPPGRGHCGEGSPDALVMPLMDPLAARPSPVSTLPQGSYLHFLFGFPLRPRHWG